jgi:AraC-like DNA-binding protein
MTGTPKELTETPEPAITSAPADVLRDVLSKVRLLGAIFLRAEYTTPWAYESPPQEALAMLLGPRSERLVLFHLVAEGRCWIRVSSGAELEARAGEMIVLPYGEQHVMGSSLDVPPVPISEILAMPPWETMPVIRHGGGGTSAQVVCGYLHCSDPIFDPVLGALPPLFSVRPPSGPAATWMAASIQYALDATKDSPQRAPDVALRLPELLFQEVLRLYVESGPPKLGGWLAALHDPIVGPALAELHRDPSHKWTADELAERVFCSRSTLNDRFGRLMGRPPITYLSEWRLQVASNLLRETSLAVAAVAFQVGYESEEAFNRAFKRAHGKPPAQWRQTASLSSPDPLFASRQEER